MANILHLTHRYWPVPGGSEQYLRQIATRQASEGYQVTVVATNAYDLAHFWDPRARSLPPGETAENNVRIIRVPVKHVPGSPWCFGILRRLQVAWSRLPKVAHQAGWLAQWAPYLPDLAPTLGRLGNQWQCVYSWNITFDGLAARARSVALRSRSAFVAVPFLHLGERSRSMVRRYYTMPHQVRLLREADIVIVQTEIEREFLIRRGLASDQIVIAGAGIEPETLGGGEACAFGRRYKVKSPVVTAIGPKTFDKGTIHLVEAARGLWREGHRFSLALVGPMMADFQVYWQRLPAEDQARCLCLDVIDEKEKRDLLAAADVLVLASRTESFGIPLLEAWFYGKPVIGAQAGGIPAVIADGMDGRLVPFGDVPALAKAIVEVLQDPALSQRWGTNGRHKAMTHFTWPLVYQRFTSATAALLPTSAR